MSCRGEWKWTHRGVCVKLITRRKLTKLICVDLESPWRTGVLSHALNLESAKLLFPDTRQEKRRDHRRCGSSGCQSKYDSYFLVRGTGSSDPQLRGTSGSDGHIHPTFGELNSLVGSHSQLNIENNSSPALLQAGIQTSTLYKLLLEVNAS